MSKIRVGFIGAGRISGLHALAYRGNPDAVIHAVADTDLTRAQTRAAEWGATSAYSDYRDLLADPAVDAVEVMLPYHLNSSVVVAALDAGKHVSLEKPMAPNLRDAYLMIRAAERSRAFFRVFENFRSYEPFLRAKALIDAGEIGDPIALRVKMVMGKGLGGWTMPGHAVGWRLERESRGDSLELLDGGYHVASIVTHLMGPVEKVHTMAATVEERSGARRPVPPMVVAWKHSGGARYGSWEIVSAPNLLIRTQYYPGDELTEITGTRGIVWVNRCSGDLLGVPPVSLYRDGRTQHFDDLETDLADSFRRAGLDFIAAIRDGTQPRLDAREARSVLTFSLAAIRSATEQREIALTELDA